MCFNKICGSIDITISIQSDTKFPSEQKLSSSQLLFLQTSVINPFMLYSIITTIQEPTPSVFGLVDRLNVFGGKLVVAGDVKGPFRYEGPRGKSWPVEFFSINEQEKTGFRLAEKLPTKHYARKNIAYLHAIRKGAECIYETDDDNAPNDQWQVRQEVVKGARVLSLSENSRWVNVYRYFTDDNIWPRGLPLDEIRQQIPQLLIGERPLLAPVQQGLVDGSADVDAIWRLVMDRDFHFEVKPSVYLNPGNWCPFNTQSTWWWPMAYPLLYIPSYCSFRMCDIWKSFIAQRCLWAMGLGVVFHPPEVVQDRNPHDLMRDFRDEIPGYVKNRRIAEILDGLVLLADQDAVGINLRTCYVALIAAGLFPEQELELVDAWLDDAK
jgi:hypothetical protein